MQFVPLHAGSKRTFGLLYKVYHGGEEQVLLLCKVLLGSQPQLQPTKCPRWSCCCSNTSSLHTFLLLVKRGAGYLGNNTFQSHTQNFAILFDSAQVLVCCVIHAYVREEQGVTILVSARLWSLWHPMPQHLESSKLDVNP